MLKALLSCCCLRSKDCSPTNSCIWCSTNNGALQTKGGCMHALQVAAASCNLQCNLRLQVLSKLRQAERTTQIKLVWAIASAMLILKQHATGKCQRNATHYTAAHPHNLPQASARVAATTAALTRCSALQAALCSPAFTCTLWQGIPN